MDDNQEKEEYNYDIGYYEGIRNILQIINQTLGDPRVPQLERIDLCLKYVMLELNKAKEQIEYSENKLFGYSGYDSE